MNIFEAVKELKNGKKIERMGTLCENIVDISDLNRYVTFRDLSSEWRVKEDLPQRLHSFMEAISLLRGDKRMKRLNWTHQHLESIGVLSGNIYIRSYGTESVWTPMADDIEARDWVRA